MCNAKLIRLPRIIALLLLFVSCQSKIVKRNDKSYKIVCGKYYIHPSTFSLLEGDEFTSNEKLLICGSDTPGWKKPPEQQAKSFIENFLNSRGHYNIRFIEDNGKILIEPGPPSEIKHIKFYDTPPDFLESRFIGLEGKIISSDSLDQIRQWSLSRMRTLSYPCPQAEARANPQTQRVDIYLKPGEKEQILSLERSNSNKLNPEALSRFDAFRIDDVYKDENFILTSRRLINSGLVNYSDFHNHCDKSDRIPGHFSQEITYSPPRRFIFAIGGTTEEYPILKLSWEHNRIDPNASRFFSKLYASSREQSLTSKLNWYPFKNYPRLHFVPEIEVARFSEQIYEALAQKLSFALASSLDTFSNHYRWELSPAYNVEQTLRGAGPSHTSYLSIDSQLSLISHEFEFYQNSPRKGYFLDFDWSTRKRGLGSNINLNRYLFSLKYLINWGGFEPPLIVFGFRFQYAFLDTVSIADTPTSARLYLGGDDNIRGFARRSLNNQGLGYSSYMYLGTEVRFLQIIPYQLQPFVLFDIAKVARTASHFIEPTLTSLGVGMRWQSSFGSFRSTVAKGMIDDHKHYQLGPTDQWKVFISFGKEF